MRHVTDTRSTPDPDGGERRLARPPSERFAREAEPPTEPSEPADRASAARGVAFGATVAVLGAVIIVLLGGPMAISAGLLVAAVVLGYGVGLATVVGAADTLSGRARPWIAASLAGAGTLLGQLGLWLFARAVGGVLLPVDYLAQTFGPLVPLEILLAAGVAWWRAR
jgi:hypothetical protein